MNEVTAKSFYRTPAILLNVLTVLVAWLHWTGGNFFYFPGFFVWAGKEPFLHRMLLAGSLAVYFVLVCAARRCFSTDAAAKVWIFRLGDRLAHWKNSWVVLGLCTFSVWSLGRVSAARYESFCSGFDLAIFDQAIWNTLHGKFLFSSIKGHICLLGDHMSPILLLYVPGMALWEDARALLWLQACVVGLHGFLIYRLCARQWARSPLNWAFPLAYFLYLPARNVAQFEFHPEVLADTFIFLMFLSLFAGKPARFMACVIGLILCKETFWVLAFFVGIFMMLFGKKMWGEASGKFVESLFPARRWGMILALLAPLAFWMEIHWLIPWVSGKPYPYTGNYALGNLMSLLGQGFSLSSMAYLIKLFAPLGLLSLLSPRIAFLTGFGLLQNLFSRNPATHSIFFQYTIGLTPFVFIAAIHGAKRFAEPGAQARCALWLMVCSLLFAGPSDHYRFLYYQAQKNPRLIKIQGHLEKIPPQTIVRTNEFFAVHLSHRPYLYIPDDGNFYSYERAAEKGQGKIVVLGDGFGGGASGKNFRFLREHGYETVLEEDGFYVMKEKAGT